MINNILKFVFSIIFIATSFQISAMGTFHNRAPMENEENDLSHSSIIEDLPNEILIKIFDELEFKDGYSIQLVSKKFKSIACHSLKVRLKSKLRSFCNLKSISNRNIKDAAIKISSLEGPSIKAKLNAIYILFKESNSHEDKENYAKIFIKTYYKNEKEFGLKDKDQSKKELGSLKEYMK